MSMRDLEHERDHFEITRVDHRPVPWDQVVSILNENEPTHYTRTIQYLCSQEIGHNTSFSPNETTPFHGDKSSAEEEEDKDFSSSKWSKLFILMLCFTGLGSVCIGIAFTFPCSEHFFSIKVDILEDEQDRMDFFLRLVYLGTFVGCLISCTGGNRYGRIALVECSCIPILAGWLLMSFSVGQGTLLLGRWCVGVGCGMFISILPVYMTEISPCGVRGRVVAIVTFLYSIGVLLVPILSKWVTWQTLASISSFPVSITLVGLDFLPDSPSSLFFRTMDDKTLSQLMDKLLVGSSREKQEELLYHMQLFTPTAQPGQQHRRRSSRKARRYELNRSYQSALYVCLVLFVLQQVLLLTSSKYYTPYPSISSLRTYTWEKVIVIVASFVLFFLCVDSLGRRGTIIGGSIVAIMARSVFLHQIYRAFISPQYTESLSVSMNITENVAVVIGIGLIPLLFSAEILPLVYRSIVIPALVFLHYLVEWATLYAVPKYTGLNITSHSLDSTWNIVLFYLANTMVIFIALYYLPETKQRPLVEIESILMNFTAATPPMVPQGTSPIGDTTPPRVNTWGSTKVKNKSTNNSPPDRARRGSVGSYDTFR